MKKANLFSNPEILRKKWLIFTKEDKATDIAEIVSSELIEIMHKNNWVWVSPQNLVNQDNSERDNFYKKIIIIKNLDWKENVEIINPKYKVLDNKMSSMYEACGSIETIDTNPFMTLNMVPYKIKVTGLNKSYESIEYTLTWTDIDKQEEISYIIHEINHCNWKIITDWGIIRSLIKWNKVLHKDLARLYPELLPSFIEFDWNSYTIHSISEEWILNPTLNWKTNSFKCSKIQNNTKWNDILPFHFDTSEDFQLFKSDIYNWNETYKITHCKECFK